nr:hypothetical protein [Geomonas oryzisoli]
MKITCFVVRKLFLPKKRVRFGLPIANRAAMPKTAIDKYGNLLLSENNIGGSCDPLGAQTIPSYPRRPQGSSESHLNFSIPTANRLHVSAAGLFTDPIHALKIPNAAGKLHLEVDNEGSNGAIR